MAEAETPRQLIAYPDPITAPETLSGAAFLYFDGPIVSTLPPQVVTEASYDLLPLIAEKRPAWGDTFTRLFSAWRGQQDAFRRMRTILAPLQARYKTVWVVYPADADALGRASNLLTESGFSLDEAAEMIEPRNAAGELIRHIMLEEFAEFNNDAALVYDYCSELFASAPIPHLLVKSYCLRLPMLSDMFGSGRKHMPLMLTNERLLSLFSKLPVEPSTDEAPPIDVDVISWEIFRQVVSPHLDPIDDVRVEIIARLVSERRDQISRLRRKCLALADQIRDQVSQGSLTSQVQTLVWPQVEKELAEVLQLDATSLEKFKDSLLGDEKAWVSLLGFIASVVLQQANLITGAAIAGLSVLAVKGYKALVERREKLKTNDYALVYSVRREIERVPST